MLSVDDLKMMIRDIPDFPKKGVIFKDITTLLSNAEGLCYFNRSDWRSIH